MRRTTISAPVALIAIALAIAGCGGTSAAGTTAPSGAPGASVAGGGSTPAPTAGAASLAGPAVAGTVEDGIGHPVNVCDVLPVATVASITGETLTVATEDDTLAYKIYACTYTNAAGTAEVRVSVLALDAAAGFDGGLQVALTTGGKQIAGLGDKADSSALGVEALFGNVSISVSNAPSDDVAATIIKTLQPKL